MRTQRHSKSPNVRTRGFRPLPTVLPAILAPALCVGSLAAQDQDASGTDTPGDPAIESAVERELRHDPAVPADDVFVEVSDGVAVLDGTVDTLLESRFAVRLAETVRGVRAVVDEIDVVPDVRSDEAVAEDVETALLEDPAADSYEVTVHVEDGVVTLRGSVDSWTERELARRVATGVRGVRDVQDELDVIHTGDRPDPEVRAEVAERLRWDALVDDSGIEVAVQDGQVKLSGYVGSVAEKRRARLDSWVQGVSSVATDDLEIFEWTADEDVRETPRDGWDRKAVEDAIQVAMRYEPRVEADRVDVDFAHSVATLSGTVDDVAARMAAERCARDTEGVVAVANEIRVDAVVREDSQLESAVNDAFVRDPFLESYEIDTEADRQDIILTGTVESWFEKLRATDVAASIRGVDEVDNRIAVVTPEPYVYDPYVEGSRPWSRDWYDYEPAGSYEPDFLIEDRIEDEFLWSPYVDASDVNVGVANGVVTLTGTVDSWTERGAAERNAYEGGAVDVINELDVGVSDF